MHAKQPFRIGILPWPIDWLKDQFVNTFNQLITADVSLQERVQYVLGCSREKFNQYRLFLRNEHFQPRVLRWELIDKLSLQYANIFQKRQCQLQEQEYLLPKDYVTNFNDCDHWLVSGKTPSTVLANVKNYSLLLEKDNHFLKTSAMLENIRQSTYVFCLDKKIFKNVMQINQHKNCYFMPSLPEIVGVLESINSSLLKAQE